MRRPTPRWVLITGVLLTFGCRTGTYPADRQAAPPAKSHTFEAAEAKMHEEKRPIVVFLHTNWCQYCQNMEMTTFRNDQIGTLLHTHFYFIRFDGESTEAVTFRGRTYYPASVGSFIGDHPLAQDLGNINGTLSYPTLVILNPDYEIIFQHNGYLDAQALIGILQEILRQYPGPP